MCANKQTGSAISVTYTNLSPGEYILKVKTANKDNVWNPEIRKLKIKILPPWWRTNWAYAGYFLLIVLISILIYRIIRERVRTNNELKIEKIKKEQSEKLNELKLSFFTSISHEIRTPLTLILGPLEDIIQKEKKDTGLYRQLSMMQKNANLLLQLVTQVLDFRKIEKEKTVLKIGRINLNDFIIQTIGQFEGKTNQNNISMQFLSKKQNIELWADNSLLQKIIFNLLSNAIRYTNENGFVQITIEETENIVRIKIADNGIGIERKDLPNIFERFYQSGNRGEGGSGIGLSLVKKMVELQKGTIKVESQLGKGSEFIIDFQKGNTHFNPADIVTTNEDSETEPSKIEILNNVSSKKAKHNIIVIDDNDDIRNYVKNSLETEYKISDFNNAGDGLLMAQKQDVSLIICDIMMPGMDGLEFCEHIKTDVNTSHIPVILLTAKIATENQVEGYEKGADDYICKPFSIILLKTRIANIIEQREKLQLKIKALNLEPSKISPTSVDEKFLEKTIGLIEENISNHEYTIDELSFSIGLNHDNFYRKIKNLTGMSAAKFIRMIRLKRAKQLLENSDYTISEILYQVGFSNPSYFAKCFKQQFGVSPTEFRK